MKKFSVLEDCISCGMCVTMTDLLKEDSRGKVYPEDNGYIKDSYVKEAQRIVEICPVKAIHIIETKNVKASGREGLKELKEVLRSKLQSVTIPEVTLKDVKFNASNYVINYGNVSGEYEYRYTSDSQAERAGLEEFNRVAYSQYRPFILSVFVQYKNDKLKSFYTLDENSFFWQVNNQFEKVLKEIVAEANSLSDGKLLLPRDFTSFEVYPGGSKKSDRDMVLYPLKNFEQKSTESGVMAEFKGNSYSSLDSYKMYLDTDDMETYVGEDWFGNSKYKYKYCYKSVNEAISEFISDLKSAMNYVDIDETALYFIDSIISAYKREVEKKVVEKITLFVNAMA